MGLILRLETNVFDLLASITTWNAKLYLYGLFQVLPPSLVHQASIHPMFSTKT